MRLNHLDEPSTYRAQLDATTALGLEVLQCANTKSIQNGDAELSISLGDG